MSQFSLCLLTVKNPGWSRIGNKIRIANKIETHTFIFYYTLEELHMLNIPKKFQQDKIRS